MTKLSNALLALGALAFVNVAVGSTEFSSDVTLGSSFSLTGLEPHVPVVFSTEYLTTFVSASAESKATTTSEVNTESKVTTESETTTTVFTTTTVTTEVTSTIVGNKPNNTSAEDHMTVQTSIPSMNLTATTVLPVTENGTVTMPMTSGPSHRASTVVVTANRSVIRTGRPQPTASASAPSDTFNAAPGVEFAIAAVAASVAAVLLAI